jgi:hypothetical protein
MTNLLDAIGLEGLWKIDLTRRDAHRLFLHRREWLNQVQLVAATPMDLVKMLRYGIVRPGPGRAPVSLERGPRLVS